MFAQRDPLLGTVVGGRYRLIQRIAATEMSLVYRAVDGTTRERVAVKLLHAARESLAERCLREAAAMARLASPHVVRALDFGRTDTGHVFLAMEYLAGENLAETLRREGPLPWPRALHLAVQICDALVATHAAGIIHRDVKPANCMRLSHAGDPDFVKLLDFGISKNLDRSLPTLTSDGVVLGTPAYMAPELIATGEPTVASDIYAVGATLYQLVTGALPFTGQTPLDFFYHHRFSPLVPPSLRVPDRGLPPALDRLLAAAMAKDPEQRIHGVDALRAALAALRPPAAPPPDIDDSLEIRPTLPYVLATGDPPTPPEASPSLVWGDTEPVVADGWPPALPPAQATPATPFDVEAPAAVTVTAEGPEAVVSWAGVVLRAAAVAVMALLFGAASVVLAPVTWPEDLVSGEGLVVAPPPPLAARAVAAPLVVEPALDAEAPLAAEGGPAPYPRRRALAALAPHHAALRACGERAQVWGVIRAQVRVDPSGRVDHLRLLDPTGPAALATCLEGQLRAIHFPAHPGGGTLVIAVDVPVFLPMGGGPA